MCRQVTGAERLNPSYSALLGEQFHHWAVTGAQSAFRRPCALK